MDGNAKHDLEHVAEKSVTTSTRVSKVLSNKKNLLEMKLNTKNGKSELIQKVKSHFIISTVNGVHQHFIRNLLKMKKKVKSSI